MRIPIELKVLNPMWVELNGGTYPEPSPGNAGLDLRVCWGPDRYLNSDYIDLMAGSIYKIPTGISIYIKDPNYCGLILSRSGLAYAGVTVANAPGLIDASYQGPLIVMLKYNPPPGAESKYRLYRGDRIAQLVIASAYHPEFTLVEEYSNQTERGEKGFGHSGVK